MVQFIILQAAILLGVITSFLFPYARKIIEGKIAKVDPTYIYHLVITALWQFILSFAVYSAWQPPNDIGSNVLILILAFFFGFGGSDIQKEVDKFIRLILGNRPREKPSAVVEGSTDEQETGVTITREVTITKDDEGHIEILTEGSGDTLNDIRSNLGTPPVGEPVDVEETTKEPE